MAEIVDDKKRPRQLLAGKYQRNGAIANFADSIAQDSFAGQFYQRLDLMGFEAFGFEDVPGYNALNDQSLDLDLLPYPLLEELTKSGSNRESKATIDMYNRNTAREMRLQAGGASWSRFLAGFVDPINLIPVPMTLGKGFVAGMKRVVLPNAVIVTGSEMARVAVDPTDDGSNLLLNITAGTLFATAVGGAFGHVSKHGVPHVTTPGGRTVKRGEAKLQAGANANDYIDLNQANAPGPKVSELRVNESTFPALKPYLPEGTTLDDFLSGRVHDGLPGDTLRFQSMRYADDAFGDRFLIAKVTPQLKQKFSVLAASKEGSLVLLRKRQGTRPAEVVSTGSMKDLVARVEDMGTQKVANFSARDAIGLGQTRASDVYEGIPDKHREQDAFRAFNEANSRTDTPRDSDGVKLAENNGFHNRTELARLMDTEHHEVAKTIEELEKRLEPLRAEAASLEKKIKSGKGFNKKLTKKQAIARLDEIQEPIQQLNSRIKVSRETLEEIDQKIRNAEESNNPLDYLIKPTGTKLEDFFGVTGKWPFYTLTQTKFVDLAPELAATVQKMAYRIAGTPGVAHVGAERGVSIGTSVEMKAKIWFGEFRAAKDAVDAEYAKLMGYGESMSTGEAFLVGQRQKVAKQFKRTREQLPEDAVQLEEFYNMIGKVMIHGDDTSVVLADMPVEVRKAVEAGAKHYRKLLKKFEKEGKRLGVFQTQQTIRRNLDKLDQKIAFTEERLAEIDDPKVAKVHERRLMQYELDRQRFEDAQAAYNAGVGDDSMLSEDFFHRSWDIARIVADDEGPNAPQLLRKALTRHFIANPRGWVNGKLEEFDPDPKAIDLRVTKAIAMIKREAIFDDTMGIRPQEVEAFKKEITEKLEGTRFRLAKLRERVKGQESTQELRDQAVEVTKGLRGQADIDARKAEIKAEMVQIRLTKSNRKDVTNADIESKPLVKNEKLGIVETANQINTREVAELDARFADLEQELKALNKKPAPVKASPKPTPEQLAAGEARAAAGEGAPQADAVQPKKEATAAEEILRLERRAALYEKALKDEKFVGSGMSNASMSRRISLTNQEILALDSANPFIDVNAERNIYQYTTRMGPAIEMAREFGDRGIFNEMDMLNNRIDDAIAEARAKGDTKKVDAMLHEQERVNQAVADLRDLVSGTFGTPTDPSSITARTIRLLMAYNTLTAMGRAVFAAFNDAANIVAMNGFRKTVLGDLPAVVMGRLRSEMGEWQMGKKEVEMAGEAFDVFRAARFYQYTDMGGPFYGGTKVERFVHGESGRFFVANLLSVWTDAAERFGGTLAQSRMIEDAIALNAGKLSKKRAQELFRVGMSKDLAKKIVKEWESVPEVDRRGKHLYLANTHQWQDELVVREFRAMLNNEVSALVPQPGAADKPTFMHTDWGRLIFQYKGFSMGATQRIMMANLQRKDKRALTAVVSMITLSLMIDAMKRPDYIQLDWEDQLYRAVELSGVGGILTDLNASLEGATGGDYGIRPMLGLANRERNVNVATRFGAIGGAVANQWSTLLSAYVSPDAGVDDKARAIRYMMPYNNLWIWNGLFNRAQRSAVDIFED